MKLLLSKKLATNSSLNSLQHELTDRLLMRQLVSGDKKALEILYERYFQKLCRFCSSAYGHPHPEDMVQDVFISLIEKPQVYNEKYAFSTFIYTLAANRCKKEWRKKNISRLETITPINLTLIFIQKHHNLDVRTLQNKIQMWFNTLNPKDKMLFLLRFEHELKQEEIAQIMNIPIGSVKSGLFQLLKKLSSQIFSPITTP